MIKENLSGQEKEKHAKVYEAYVKEVTKTHCLWKNMLRAFITGGTICTIAQAITWAFEKYDVKKEEAASYTLVILILCSIILTGMNVYSKIAKWGGAGALVPITGFANGVASPAIEYRCEGFAAGIGTKIFTIAGPVILYGVFTSWVIGLGYWILKAVGVF
ncbi:MAG: SpoVA/SpoVAEb family sporulation membrane protein [Lachnospiraceae bacterium]|nr:SpoVA/SpoVAEb family sporulation membrane protein [Lachnospiraceae bacterium]